jgi:hypothetical protein
MKSVCSFLCLPKETNQGKGTQALVPPKAGYPEFMPRMGYSSMLPGLCKLGSRLKQCKAPFLQPLRCSAACQWEFPHLSCRASQTGAEKDAGTV